MPTEYATGEKLLLFSFTPSIPFSFSYPPTSSSSSAPFILSSFCFSFFLLPYTSVSFSSDSGHDNNFSLESWPSMPASFSNATAILQTSFLNLLSSLRSSNFLKISVFYSMSICCFAFLAFDLQTVSALAFAYALSALKGL